MAPEIYNYKPSENNIFYDTKSDIYSVGVIFYVLYHK